MLKSFQEKMKIYDQNFLYLIRKFCKKKIARGKTFLCSNTYPPPILNPYLLPMGKGKKKVQFAIAFSQNFSQFNNFFLSYFHLVHKSMQERSKGGGGQISSPHLYDQREIYIFLWLRAHKNVMHPFWVEKAYGHSRMYPIFFWLFKGISIGRRPLLGGWFRIPRKFSIW